MSSEENRARARSIERVGNHARVFSDLRMHDAHAQTKMHVRYATKILKGKNLRYCRDKCQM